MTDLAFVANARDATISAFAVGPDTLEPLATTALPGSCSTFVVDAARDLLYAGCKGSPPLVVTHRIDRTTGVLTEVARAEVEAAPTYLDLAHRGTVLLSASYAGGVGHTWTVSDGVLGEVAARVEYPQLHCVVALGDHAYFVSLGADLVAWYDVDEDGALTPIDAPLELPPGSGPRHLVFGAEGRTGYLVTEFSGEVFRLLRGPATGALRVAGAVSIVEPSAGLRHSRLGPDPLAEHLIWGADVHVGDGFLLASERTASTIAAVTLTAVGALGSVAAWTATEQQPRGFTVLPGGDRVLVVGERSDHIALSRVTADGALEQLDRQPTGAGPNWVRVVGGGAGQ